MGERFRWQMKFAGIHVRGLMKVGFSEDIFDRAGLSWYLESYLLWVKYYNGKDHIFTILWWDTTEYPVPYPSETISLVVLRDQGSLKRRGIGFNDMSWFHAEEDNPATVTISVLPWINFPPVISPYPQLRHSNRNSCWRQIHPKGLLSCAWCTSNLRWHVWQEPLWSILHSVDTESGVQKGCCVLRGSSRL